MRRGEQLLWDAAQRDERFRAWVDLNEGVLEKEFHDVPGLPDRPWGADALLLAEQAATKQFRRPRSCFTARTWKPSWRFVRFLGQTFIDAFEGSWVNLAIGPAAEANPGVFLPFRDGYLEPVGLLTAAVNRRSGEEWAWIYRIASDDYNDWLATDRPPLRPNA